MFKDEVRKAIEEFKDGTLRCKMSAENREAINKLQTASNTEVISMGSATVVTPVDIASAIQARATGESVSNQSGVKADVIRMRGFDGKDHDYPCCVAKTTNVLTSNIKNATVWKLYADLRVTHSEAGLAARNSINDDDFNIFEKATTVDTDLIVKKTSVSDTTISATVFPGDIVLADILNALVSCNRKLRRILMREFLKTIPKDDMNAIKTAYRNINRSMAEKIFESVYSVKVGRVNEGDSASVEQFNSLMADYRDGWRNIGSIYLSSDTIKFGLSARKLSISPDVTWSNLDKMNRIKKFTSGSYYVSSNIDMGPLVIPTTPAILANHINDITNVFNCAAALVESEARLENGFSRLDIPSVPDIKEEDTTMSYSEILGITAEEESAILDELTRDYKDMAEEVINRYISKEGTASIEQVMEMINRKR